MKQSNFKVYWTDNNQVKAQNFGIDLTGGLEFMAKLRVHAQTEEGKDVHSIASVLADVNCTSIDGAAVCNIADYRWRKRRTYSDPGRPDGDSLVYNTPKNAVLRATSDGRLDKYRACTWCRGTKLWDVNHPCEVCYGQGLKAIPPYDHELAEVIPTSVVNEFATFWADPLNQDTVGDFIQRVAVYTKHHLGKL